MDRTPADSADEWDAALKPVLARYQGKVSRIYFRADAGFVNPDVYEFLEAERIKYAIRLPANRVEIAEELVRTALADHPDERSISLLAISVSHLEKQSDVQLELPLGLEGEERRPGTKRGMARWIPDCAVDMIRDRFGWEAVGYGSVALGLC
jgi:Transposase DDE domain group 1